MRYIIIFFGLFVVASPLAHADWGRSRHHKGEIYRDNYPYYDNRSDRGRYDYQYGVPYSYDHGPYDRNYPYSWHDYGFPVERAIQDGVRSGRLSRREVDELFRDQEKIRRKEFAYYADGIITRNERDDLNDEISDFHKELRHELSDGERRW